MAKQLYLFIPIFLTLIGAGLLVLFYETKLANSEKTLEELNEKLSYYYDIKVPSNSQNLVYTYRFQPYLHDAKLSFDALPEEVEKFTKAFCDGILHSGYDAFNASSSREIPQFGLLIKAQGFTYHSVSTGVPETIWGNRCVSEIGTIILITVDKTHSEYHHVDFEVQITCNMASIDLPCSGGQRNYISPIRYMPLMIIGVVKSLDSYQLISNEICIETRHYAWATPQNYKSWIGAEINFWVDGELVIKTIFPDHWSTNYKPYEECFTQNWSKGNHTMSVTISGTDDMVGATWTVSVP